MSREKRRSVPMTDFPLFSRDSLDLQRIVVLHTEDGMG
jgi:hypothetical protein